MNKIKTPARYLLGAMYLVFGLNFFFGFLPMPPPNAAAGAFMGGLFATGYMFPLVKSIEVAVGAMLLLDLFVPLALVVIAPISVNILLVHTLLDLGGLPVALPVFVLNLILGLAYMPSYKSMLKMKA